MLHFERGEQAALADRRGRGREHAAKPLVAAAGADDRTRQAVRVVDVRGARRREVTLVRKVGSLRGLHAADELGNEEIEIRVAVAMPVRREIHRDARDRRGEIGSVIEVETSQVVLIRLAFSAVLTDHHSRNGFEHLARAHDRTRVELAGGDGSLTGGLGDAHQILCRVLRVSEVRERGFAGDRHVRVEGK